MIFRIYANGQFLMNYRIWCWEANDFVAELRQAFQYVEPDFTNHTVDLL